MLMRLRAAWRDGDLLAEKIWVGYIETMRQVMYNTLHIGFVNIALLRRRDVCQNVKRESPILLKECPVFLPRRRST